MTTERWTDERLDKFAETTEANIAELQRLALESQRAQNGMFRAMDAFAVSQVQFFQKFDQMHSEIVGLQTENRRILDHLFGQQST
jgi:hypothetical protein